MISFEEVMQVTSGVSSHAAFEDAECCAYYDLLCSLPDHATVLEIGLQFGRSSSIIAQLQKYKHFNYIGIDPWLDPPEARNEWVALMMRLKATVSIHECKTSEVYKLPQLDLALIDGDHNYDGVFTDCKTVLPLVKPGGYALFHDYGPESLPNVYPTVQAEMVKEQMTAEWEELPTVGTLGIWRRK